MPLVFFNSGGWINFWYPIEDKRRSESRLWVTAIFRYTSNVWSTEFSDPTEKYSRVYVDDIVIFSAFLEEHVKHLNDAFYFLSKKNIHFTGHKSFHKYPFIHLLGQKIDVLRLTTTEDKFRVIFSLSFPKTLTRFEKYLVRWLGYGPEWDQWILKHRLNNAQDLIDDYEKPFGQTVRVNFRFFHQRFHEHFLLAFPRFRFRFRFVVWPSSFFRSRTSFFRRQFMFFNETAILFEHLLLFKYKLSGWLFLLLVQFVGSSKIKETN